jgi:hypothetical protein
MLSNYPSLSEIFSDTDKLRAFAESKGINLDAVREQLTFLNQPEPPFVLTADFVLILQYLEFWQKAPEHVEFPEFWITVKKESSMSMDSAPMHISIPAVKALRDSFCVGLNTAKRAFDAMWAGDWCFGGNISPSSVERLQYAGLYVTRSEPAEKASDMLLT